MNYRSGKLYWVGSTFEGAPVEQQALLELEDTAQHLKREKETLMNTSGLSHLLSREGNRAREDVLELGIVAHSVIIGVSLGVSNSPCTIRPLFGALCFHQFFEGFALGGCISQAGFKNTSVIVMACCFAFTTLFGIGLGIGIASSYKENSEAALIVEGGFDSISAGILIYMSLVDLVAADFLSKRMKCDRKLQICSYLSLFSGAAAMSALAIWA
ncbi:hypothetical protein R1flu_021014 [Riccia fluitans]|uniref:Uncharacterized protein n=1 Tax=Riccia fluitans TaxID=41844 RepID=A0ABD1ZPS1_9MARC